MSLVTNERLRNAIRAKGLTVATLASRLDVDPKSVQRWITQERVPHSSTRTRVVQELGDEETYYWPSLLNTSQSIGASQNELVQMWPTRDTVPHDIWRTLIDQGKHHIDVLAYSGGFLVETFRLVDVIRERTGSDFSARIILGDATSENVQRRGVEEGLPSLPARAMSTAEYLKPILELEGVELRVQSVPLYASIYRFDDQILVNSHTHGLPAKDNPIHHYREVPGGRMFRYYADAFERVWDASAP